MLFPAMFSSVSITRDSAIVAGTTALAAVAAGIVYYWLMQRRPSANELERQRRANLALHGRIVDGTLLDVMPSEVEPIALRYSYEIAGVAYECVQDVSALGDAHLNALQLEFPVLVRYNRANPADSIVVSEDWSGLRTGGPKSLEARDGASAQELA